MRGTILMLAVLLLANTLSAKTMQVNVLTLTTLPLSVNATPTRLNKNTPASVMVSMVDLPTLLLEKINQQLKGQKFTNSDGLQQAVSSRLNQQAIELHNAYIGIGLAASLQIHQLPAVVFNQKYVVYGTTDVSAAFEAYKAWKQRHGAVA